MLLLAGMALLAACDRTETRLVVNQDGSGAWERTATFVDGGVSADDFDAFHALAEEHTDDASGPDGFVAAALPLFFPDLANEGGVLAEMDKTLTTKLDLRVETTADEVVVHTADDKPDFRDLIGEFALPGSFTRDDAGNHFYRVDNAVAVLVEVPGAGSVGSPGVTVFEMEVAGDVLGHNAHTTTGRTMRWEWDPDDSAADASTQGHILVQWDPNGDGDGDVLTPTSSNSALRRWGLLAIAAVALCIGIAVLLTFRPDSWADGYDDGYGADHDHYHDHYDG